MALEAPSAQRSGHTAQRPADRRLNQVNVRMRRLGFRPDGLIEALHTAQEVFGYLDDDVLAFVAESLGVPPSKAYGVATFYSHFSLKPQGEHTCVVCCGTACYINGAAALLEAISKQFEVGPGQTTEDGHLSVLRARCFGACSMAPAVMIDGEVHGHVRAPDLVSLLEGL